jgi:hypothetical protein
LMVGSCWRMTSRKWLHWSGSDSTGTRATACFSIHVQRDGGPITAPHGVDQRLVGIRLDPASQAKHPNCTSGWIGMISFRKGRICKLGIWASMAASCITGRHGASRDSSPGPVILMDTDQAASSPLQTTRITLGYRVQVTAPQQCV